MPILQITYTPNELLEFLAMAAWDRPGAYYELCAKAGVPDAPELSMHAKDDELGWEGDDAESLAHIEQHFGIANLPRLFTRDWDT